MVATEGKEDWLKLDTQSNRYIFNRIPPKAQGSLWEIGQKY